MQTAQYEGEMRPLIKWALNRNATSQYAAPPEPYASWVVDLMPEKCRKNMFYWIGFTTPETELDGDWVDRFPHTHAKAVGWEGETTSVITYLIAPEAGGELGVGGRDENDPYEFIQPKAGLTVIIDALMWHGVKPVMQGARIALVASGTPQ